MVSIVTAGCPSFRTPPITAPTVAPSIAAPKLPNRANSSSGQGSSDRQGILVKRRPIPVKLSSPVSG